MPCSKHFPRNTHQEWLKYEVYKLDTCLWDGFAVNAVLSAVMNDCLSTVYLRIHRRRSSVVCEPGLMQLFPIPFREQPIDYGELESSIRASCKKMCLEDVDGRLRKTSQTRYFILYCCRFEPHRTESRK